MKLIVLSFLMLLLLSCGGSGSSESRLPDGGAQLNPDYSNLQPYIPSGPYADKLVACVAIENDADSCTLNELPPIGQDSLTPTIDDVLNHLVVSHTWMGDRMRDLLTLMPADMLLMLRSNTAIVIDDDIRPAHFRSATGAIYIDPAYLWLTNEEKSIINPKEDYRSDFGNDLMFKRLWRYIIDNQYAWQSYALDGTEERTIDEILLPVTWLFYHELAHANDCLPPDQLSNLNNTASYYDNFLTIYNNKECIHDRLVALFPLSSTTWSSLAGVLYQGESSTASQRAMTPEFVGAEFASDIANDTYSYSSIWEDTAMVFEAILMKRNFNADRDMVFVPYYETFDCDTALVKWGQRGRLGDPAIIDRARFVVGEILPEINFNEFYLNQQLPIDISFDTSYCSLNYSTLKMGVEQETTESMQTRLKAMRDIE